MATMLLVVDRVPIVAVSKRLGHSKVSTTLNYYGHLLPESRESLGARFERRLAAACEAIRGDELSVDPPQDRSPGRPTAGVDSGD
ncbi:MAG: hypothetical protein JO103_04845 [Candidatus Eremiobacteraeota bacterium]|nr:hypothetical protein [Candidatus Eremiobacteraeota bacterium]